jgi:class 3 adenylate cyclase
VPKVLAEFQRFSETKAELRKLFSELTPRERDILRLLAQGKSNREIAQILYLTEKTVRNYVSNIFILWKNFFAQGDATDEYLLEMLFSLQRMLEGQKQRRVFLSVDVVKSSEMKQVTSELEVEHSFQQFHSWLEGIVSKHGGQIHSVAGDGAMCMFTEDVEAVKAALELQGSIHQFNATRNLLPTPFQIRCGISAGNVPVEEGMLIGQIHSHVLDRAANLQKKAKPGGIVIGGEVSGAALMLLGTFSPLPDYPNSQVAFEWRPENEFSTEAM